MLCLSIALFIGIARTNERADRQSQHTINRFTIKIYNQQAETDRQAGVGVTMRSVCPADSRQPAR